MAAPLALVTGAPGWLGTRLVRVLAEGLPDGPDLVEAGERSVRCLVQPGLKGTKTAELAAIGARIEIMEGDLLDPPSLEAFCRGSQGAALFHCAGVIHPTSGIRQVFRVNHEGTRNLLAAAEEAGVRRAVCVSSNSPIGCNRSSDELFDESAPYNPYMAYGRSKVLMERAVREFEERGRLETVVIRPPWFYGPDQPPRQSEFFAMIRKGKAPIVGGGENRRSMAYVDNICQALLLCERVEAARGRTYWIADARPYTMNEIVDTIERLLEEEFGLVVAHRRLRLPGAASQVAGLLDRLIQLTGFYNTRIHVLSEMNKTIACSIDRARKELGYDPRISLEEGMRRSIGWCLEKGHRI
jgi:nucleoside-diphosphate-sugar epimerase